MLDSTGSTKRIPSKANIIGQIAIGTFGQSVDGVWSGRLDQFNAIVIPMSTNAKVSRRAANSVTGARFLRLGMSVVSARVLFNLQSRLASLQK